MTQVTLVIEDGQLAVPHTAFTEGWVRDIEKFPDLFGKWEWDDDTNDSVSSIKNDAGEYHPHILGGRNGYGELFTCDWAEASGHVNGHTNMAYLAIALFDARETGAMVDVSEVTLPDGRTFVIDMDHGQDAVMEANWG